MTISKLIKTEANYQAVLARIETIFDAKPGTPKGDELDLLVTLIEVYESKAFPIDLPDPIAAIRFRMEQEGLKDKDLIPYIGSASKVSEILAGKRTLSLTMMRNVRDGLGIPAEVLLKEPKTKLHRFHRATPNRVLGRIATRDTQKASGRSAMHPGGSRRRRKPTNSTTTPNSKSLAS